MPLAKLQRGIHEIEHHPNARKCGAELVFVLKALERVNRENGAAGNEHALNEACEHQQHSEQPLRHEPLLFEHQSAHAHDHHNGAVNLRQNVQRQHRVEPNAHKHERRHNRKHNRELAPVDVLPILNGDKTAADHAGGVEHGDALLHADGRHARRHRDNVASKARYRLNGIGDEEHAQK